MDSDAILAQYEKECQRHFTGTQNGNYRLANSAHDKIVKLFTALCALKEDNRLFDLYEHVDSWVQVWAATHTLELDEDKAMAKLQHLEKSSIPLVSFDAEYVLSEWNAGKLRSRQKMNLQANQ